MINYDQLTRLSLDAAREVDDIILKRSGGLRKFIDYITILEATESNERENTTWLLDAWKLLDPKREKYTKVNEIRKGMVGHVKNLKRYAANPQTFTIQEQETLRSDLVEASKLFLRGNDGGSSHLAA
ncbi:hypothetical protein CMI48_03635 [Candidatus Pacearchaeota archaeon]|nr:hypothetical protein [Candidatus Pacearchaeota archaeon]|tara:strand:+ start:507 stop:887 length:381 start_codon:yes stop_codon:yes gene_type:complete